MSAQARRCARCLEPIDPRDQLLLQPSPGRRVWLHPGQGRGCVDSLLAAQAEQLARVQARLLAWHSAVDAREPIDRIAERRGVLDLVPPAVLPPRGWSPRPDADDEERAAWAAGVAR